MAETILDRFEKNITHQAGSECWMWHGPKGHNGYGSFKSDSAHRTSYYLYIGEIPPKMCVCHTCDTPGCVNPKHLWLGTAADNMRDKAIKGRARGELAPGSKLTESDVIVIRGLLAAGEMGVVIAEAFGVTQQTICDIKHRRSWAYL